MPYSIGQNGDTARYVMLFKISQKRVSVSDTIHYDTARVPFLRGKKGSTINRQFVFFGARMREKKRFNGYFLL